VVDVGCGTGRFSAALADYLDARVIGVDPSAKMLAQAQQTHQDGRMSFVQGAAEGLPLPDQCADLLFLSMVIHHFRDKAGAFDQFARVLRTGGHLCLRMVVLDTLDSFPWLRCFPEAWEIEQGRVPTRADIYRWAEGSGFGGTMDLTLQQRFAHNPQEYVAKIGRRGLSSLKAVSDEAFAAGLARLEAYCRDQMQGPADEQVDLFIFRKL
jgi:ubiquinone/menaquinone biosynthesis C-methylase UbiE